MQKKASSPRAPMTVSEAIVFIMRYWREDIFTPLGNNEGQRAERLKQLLHIYLPASFNQDQLISVLQRIRKVRTQFERQVLALNKNPWMRERQLWHLVCVHLDGVPTKLIRLPQRGEILVLWMHFGIHLDEAVTAIEKEQFSRNERLDLETVHYRPVLSGNLFTDEERALLEAMGGLMIGIGGGELDDHIERDGKEASAASIKLARFDQAYVDSRMEYLRNRCTGGHVPVLDEINRRRRVGISYTVATDIGVAYDFGLGETGVKSIVYTIAHALEYDSNGRLNVTFDTRRYTTEDQRRIVLFVKRAMLSWMLVEADPDSEFGPIGILDGEEGKEVLVPEWQKLLLNVIASKHMWVSPARLPSGLITSCSSVAELRSKIPLRPDNWHELATQDAIAHHRTANPKATVTPEQTASFVQAANNIWQARRHLYDMLEQTVKYDKAVCGHIQRMRPAMGAQADQEDQLRKKHLAEGVQFHEANDAFCGNSPFSLYHIWWRLRQCENLPDDDIRKIPEGYADETMRWVYGSHLDTQAAFWIGGMEDVHNPAITRWVKPFCTWQDGKHSVPWMAAMVSSNWKIASAANFGDAQGRRSDISVVQDPFLRTYMVRINKRYTPTALVDALLRSVIATLRLLEMKVNGKELVEGVHKRARYWTGPDGKRKRYYCYTEGHWDKDGFHRFLSKAGRFSPDDPWFGAAKDLGIFGVFRGSKFHPNTEPTDLSMKLVLLAVRLVWSISYMRPQDRSAMLDIALTTVDEHEDSSVQGLEALLESLGQSLQSRPGGLWLEASAA